MAGRSKPSPIEAFKDNMADAHLLVALAESLTNSRQRRMRTELRDSIGTALKVKKAQRQLLDCLQSPDVFLVFLPGSRLTRDELADARPLLRQALVAACAATETFLADKAMTKVGSLITSEAGATKRIRDLPMSVGEWLYIEQHYQRRRRGLRERVLEPYVREFASTSPSKVGALLSMLDVEQWAKKVDLLRSVESGETGVFLERVTARRNRIAHTGDRQGYGRAALSLSEVKEDLEGLESFVAAVDSLLA